VILTVTLNAALDVTYEVDALVPQGSHRVRRIRERAGGKGINVASVLVGMGVPAMATGLLGGPTGSRIAADLNARSVPHAFHSCAGDSRRTLNIVSADDGEATIFNERGPLVTPEEWTALLDRVTGLITRTAATVVVLSGSLPRGVPEDAYGQLIVLTHAHGARSILDANGPALGLALAAHPDLVKPNVMELIGATGVGDPVAGAEALRRNGALDVVVSAGRDGVVALPRDGGVLGARLRAPLAGNPTGAGDAMVAAFAAGLADNVTADPATEGGWATMLTAAVAWSGAAVLQPVAGAVDLHDVARLVPEVEMEMAKDDAGRTG